MADLYNKIKIYLGRDFTAEEVLLQDDQINRVSNPYIKEWNVAEAQPTDAQLDALDAQATTIESNNQVINTRIKLYGTTAEQLEYIVENGVDSFIAKQNKIKTDNPKS
jgi:hypothetical protein